MSTYNKKLPKPSDYCFMDKNRENRTKTIHMPFGGTIQSGASYIGWKQNSFSYSYQPQYQVVARLTPSKQLDTGSSTSTTAWKWVNPNWVHDPAKPDTHNSGVNMDTKNKWYRYVNFAGKSLMTAGTYDKLTIKVRIRPYNSKAKQHGAWTTQTLDIVCVPNVTVEKIVALADGGFNLHVNTNGWMRGGSEIVIGSIKRNGSDIDANKAQLTESVDAIGEEQAQDYPFATFAGSDFNDGFAPNDSVTLEGCYFKTCDGATVSIDGTYSIDSVSSVIDVPNLHVERNEDDGTVKATFTKSDTNDDWDDVCSWMLCKIGGEWVRFDAVEATGSGDSVRTRKFMPPFDSEMKVHVSITNNLGGAVSYDFTANDDAKLAPIPAKNRIMVNYTDGTDKQPKNGMFNGSSVAAMVYETDFSTDASRAVDSEMPFGRKRPVAFFGEGIEQSISVSGSIGATDDGEFEPVAHSGYSDWKRFQEQQGLVLLRLPDGEWFHAACTKCAIKNDDEFGFTKSVSLSFVEVDV